MSSGVRRRCRTQGWAGFGLCLPQGFGNWGLSGTAQSWCGEKERKFLEGKSREEEQGWRSSQRVLGGDGHRDLGAQIFWSC